MRDEVQGQLNVHFKANHRPKIITLCGSTRFSHAYELQQLQLTLLGYIVLTVGVNLKSHAFLHITPEQKAALDELHLRKIEMSDAIMVLNVDGYIGESTESEIKHALDIGVAVRFLEPYKLVNPMLKLPIDDYLANLSEDVVVARGR